MLSLQQLKDNFNLKINFEVLTNFVENLSLTGCFQKTTPQWQIILYIYMIWEDKKLRLISQ